MKKIQQDTFLLIFWKQKLLHMIFEVLKVSGRQVAGACEYGNEPSGSIKWGEFLD